MFRYLRRREKPHRPPPAPEPLAVDWLARDPDRPISVQQINGLPDNAKKRIYRALLPADLLVRFGIDPVSWQGTDGRQQVSLAAEEGTNLVRLSAGEVAGLADAVYYLELQDTATFGINLNFIVLSDPKAPRFDTDYDQEGRPTSFGTIRRHLAAEEGAMQAGLAPAQVRRGLGASKLALGHLEAFLVTYGHTAYFLEPLTYASAWVFERRGFAYVRGHQLMEDIQSEFQSGGRLDRALDGSTPFRQPDQGRTVLGRAWAIHDGILEAMGAQWDGLRMIKRVGRHAGVETFPGAVYGPARAQEGPHGAGAAGSGGEDRPH
jgi:acetoin utilization protein AcuC